MTAADPVITANARTSDPMLLWTARLPGDVFFE